MPWVYLGGGVGVEEVVRNYIIKQPSTGHSVSCGQKGSYLDLHDELWLEKWSGAH